MKPLSEKEIDAWNVLDSEGYYWKEDVAQAVKELRDEDDCGCIECRTWRIRINEIFGEFEE